jgi:glucokinase
MICQMSSYGGIDLGGTKIQAVIVGGGLGVRLGDPYAKRIAEAMQPHLFADDRPPHVHVAALGDLGGAIGASLLPRPVA